MSVTYPDDFYGFPQVPLHVHLGMRFLRERPDGPATVVLPALPEFTHEDGTQSPAAVFTIGEVAAGIAVCDALMLHATEAETEMMPLVLTRETRFTPRAPARGELRSRTGFVGDSGAAVEKLKRSRKVRVETEARLYDEHDEVVGELLVSFYVRLMPLERLKAMAGALTPRMAGEREATPS
ncbi:MAG: hypothetical protein ACJ77M_04695 [Thermoleophilaceae bacterium]